MMVETCPKEIDDTRNEAMALTLANGPETMAILIMLMDATLGARSKKTEHELEDQQLLKVREI